MTFLDSGLQASSMVGVGPQTGRWPNKGMTLPSSRYRRFKYALQCLCSSDFFSTSGQATANLNHPRTGVNYFRMIQLHHSTPEQIFLPGERRLGVAIRLSGGTGRACLSRPCLSLPFSGSTDQSCFCDGWTVSL